MTVTQVSVAARYAGEVRTALADLPRGEVDGLSADLDEHLADVAAELGEATYEALVARLGPPAAYAAELRRAAGLPPRFGVRMPADVLPGWRAAASWWLLLVAVPTVLAIVYSVPDAWTGGMGAIGPWELLLIVLVLFGWLPGLTALWIASRRFPAPRQFLAGLLFRGVGRRS
ncbi:MAG TPA: hypothetical protein VF053_21505 [Streptosporangiales bacterium]